jgi:hypothetical protein
MQSHNTKQEEIIYYVRTLDAVALEHVLWRRNTPDTLEIKNIETSRMTCSGLTNINQGMSFEMMPHGWWVDNGTYKNLHGYKMHPKIHSIGSLLHILTSLYYELRTSVFHTVLLESYQKVFKVLLDHGADPNNQLTHDFANSNMHGVVCAKIMGQTPLHFAVAQFDIEGVKILLANGADPNLEYVDCMSVIGMVEEMKTNHSKAMHPYSPYSTNTDDYTKDAAIIYDLVMKFNEDIRM